jgi:uncharacterized membrane protein/mono/diheme cytochrome c family protein
VSSTSGPASTHAGPNLKRTPPAHGRSGFGQSGPDRSRTIWSRPVWIGAVVFCLILALLPWIVTLDGHPHADWQQFLGRFHPLTVHIPIGLLVLLPLLELGGIFRPALREAAASVLALAFLGCLLALTCGLLLAHGGGQTGTLVSHHMAGGIALTITVLLALLTRPAWAPRGSAGPAALAYPFLLTTALLILTWTAHQGGSLTHGSSYLTQYMPPALKRLVPTGLSGASGADPNSFYAQHINPILDANCVSCHGEGKISGGLRLDSYDRLMRGGQNGAVVVAGNPDASILLKRVMLPASDKLFMPAEGRPPLKPDEIAIIKAWIQQGASPTAQSLNGVALREKSHDAPIEPVGDYSALLPQIRQLAAGQGAKLQQISAKPSDGLALLTVDASSSFSDAQLAELKEFAPYIVEADLARTALTDAGLDTLKQFTHLRVLHLEGTHITDAGLAQLKPLTQLTYLNLSGTPVTAPAVAPLRAMPHLAHLYLFNTPAQPVPPPLADGKAP